MAYSAIATISTGDLVPTATINQWGLNEAFLYGAPSCRLSKSANQNISHDTETSITFDGERYDNATMHDNSTNPSRITIPVAGVYWIYGGWEMAADATGYRYASILVDGTTTIGTHRVTQAAAVIKIIQTGALYKFTANQYVELRAYQNSTSTLAVTGGASTAYTTEFGAVWVSSGA